MPGRLLLQQLPRLAHGGLPVSFSLPGGVLVSSASSVWIIGQLLVPALALNQGDDL